MANELQAATDTGQTVYVLLKNRAGLFWNGVSFEAYATANRGNYELPLTELGTASGIYQADFPVALTSAGSFSYLAYIQSGGSPAEGDSLVNTGSVDWTGSAAANASAGSMTGSDWAEYVRNGGWKRTDKDDELFEATTDAIQMLRRRYSFDEAQADSQTTDSITVLGDFQIEVEDDFGLLTGVIMEDGQNAHPLIQRSKAEFDELYPDIHVTNDRGYPKHFTIHAGAIIIGPIPDSVDYVYRKTYSRSAGTITAATTAVPFTALYREVLRYFVLARLWELMDKFDRSQWFEAKGEKGYEEARLRENMNQGKTGFVVKQFCA